MNDIVESINKAVDEGVAVNVSLDAKSIGYFAGGVFFAVLLGIVLANIVIK